jgi:hypothetical protein
MGNKIILILSLSIMLIFSCQKEECTSRIKVITFFPDTNWLCYTKNYKSFIIKSSDSLIQTLYTNKAYYYPDEFGASPVYNFNVKPGDECKDFIPQSRNVTTKTSIYDFSISYGLEFNPTNNVFNFYYYLFEDDFYEVSRINLNADSLTYNVFSDLIPEKQNLKCDYYEKYTNRFGNIFDEVFVF